MKVSQATTTRLGKHEKHGTNAACHTQGIKIRQEKKRRRVKHEDNEKEETINRSREAISILSSREALLGLEVEIP
jgi:hypothetical protein